ncbi:MAG: hypothetical protein LBI12_06560 [Treponema sp.]|jgi:hypothetical protein|nr:hypothetical protein [Treponema sp.]
MKAQRVDLYSILVSYVTKNDSPFIPIEKFISFLGKYAKKTAEEHPEWLKWADDTAPKLWKELVPLIEEGKCELLQDTPEGRIYLPNFYLQHIEKYYHNIDNCANLPFPCEESMRISIPESQVCRLEAGPELTAFLDKPRGNKNIIVNISFPNGFDSALVPVSHVPLRLMEACLLKVRHYFTRYGNKEYTLNKLAAQLVGKESFLREFLNNIHVKPLNCLNAIKEGNEFSYLFWSHFCVLVKNDIKKKKEYTSGDIAIVQTVYIIESMNVWFKVKAVKKREKEIALRNMEHDLAKPPYFFTLDQIIHFTSPKAIPLLKYYTREELVNHLEKLSNESKDGKMPELIIFTRLKHEHYFIVKNKMLALCNQLVSDARDDVRIAVTKHWSRLLRNFRKEPAMENDKEFEKLLYSFMAKTSPMLNALLEDPKFRLVYEEFDRANEITKSSRYYIKGILIPCSALFKVKRKEILHDAKTFLPFWYTIPFFAFFAALFSKASIKKQAAPDDNKEPEAEKDEENIAMAAHKLKFIMVPPEHTIDSYLEELQTRWSKLISKKAREDLAEDINSLVRDNLRKVLRKRKHYKITRENLTLLASSIITRTSSLHQICSMDYLKTYIEVYLIKLLENVKFEKIKKYSQKKSPVFAGFR